VRGSLQGSTLRPSTSATRASDFASHHHIPTAYGNYHELLADASIDIVCICVPNSMHTSVIVDAARAGKHIICEKPLTGAFGDAGRLNNSSRAKSELTRALAAADEAGSVIRSTGVLFMYAENWIYAPAMAKAKSLLAVSKGVVLDVRAEESHSGSHAQRTRERASAGGGALLTLGSHAIGAAIHLKNQEALIHGGKPIRVESVTADIANFELTNADSPAGRNWLVEDWDDVERWANIVLRFTDGSRAVITASFAMLGGVRNQFEFYSTNASFRGNMTPNNGLLVFTPDAEALGNEYLHEKLESRTGWIAASPDEDWARGYPQEMQHFMSCATQGTEPLSGFELARDVVEVVYSGYVSAEEGRRVQLSNGNH